MIYYAMVWFVLTVIVFIIIGILYCGLIAYPIQGFALFGLSCISCEIAFLLLETRLFNNLLKEEWEE